jgi:tRNA A37 threonylcarbamoyladenosine dehydratase
MNPWDRLEIIYGKEKVDKLRKAHVLIAGLGGVGSYSAEAIARSFVGHITLIDFDCYEMTNLNRQLYATHPTLGQPKTKVLSEALNEIHPPLIVTSHQIRLTDENIPNLLSEASVDYVIDAIDDIQAKRSLISYCHQHNLPIISCMGTGFRKNPQAFEIADISKTYNCPMAKRLRKELKSAGISKHMVVFSKELPSKKQHGTAIGSNAFVPASAGLLLASHVVHEIMEKD